MTVITLNRKRNALYIGEHDEDIEDYRNIAVLYNVTHVTRYGDGWYDIHSGKTILGHITDVKNVKEKW